MEVRKCSVRDVINDCRSMANQKCGPDAGPEQRAAMTQFELARRAVAAEWKYAAEVQTTERVRMTCDKQAERAKVAEQCRDTAEAKAAGWKIVALLAVVVALLCALNADTNRRNAAYWQAKAQETTARPSIARIEKDTAADRAVVWYK